MSVIDQNTLATTIGGQFCVSRAMPKGSRPSPLGVKRSGDGVRSPQMLNFNIRAEGPTKRGDSTYGLG